MNVGFNLNDDQKRALFALRDFLCEPDAWEFGLFGHAGTGKTTVLVRLADTIEFQAHKILLTAPTHKATRVLAEMAHHHGIDYDTRTLQSALAMKPEVENGQQVFRQSTTGLEQAPVQKYTVVVVDECSMIDTHVYHVLKKTAEKYGVKIVFTGDPYQLPPVGEESTNGGRSLTFNVPNQLTLTKVERCAGNLHVVVDKARELIGTGQLPSWENRNEVRRFKRPGKFAGAFLEHAETGKVVTFTNKSVRSTNDWVHRQLHGENAAPYLPGDVLYAATGSEHWAAHQPFEITSAKPQIVEGLDAWLVDLVPSAVDGWGDEEETWRDEQMPRSHVSVTLPDPGAWDAYAAEVARRRRVALDFQGKARLEPDSRDKWKTEERQAWRAMYAYKNTFADFRRKYAMTVHASQGSTYPQVYVIERNIMKCQHALTKSKLVYVAYSRASEKLGVV